MLQTTFIYFICAFTSIAVFILAVRHLGLKTAVLRRAVRDVVECVGAFIVFLTLNLAVGMTIIFFIREVWHFFPLYTLADAALFVVSAFQGFVFQLWWRRSRQM